MRHIYTKPIICCLSEIQIKLVFWGFLSVYLLGLLGGAGCIFFCLLFCFLLVWQPILPSFLLAILISGFCLQDDFRVTRWLLELQPSGI